MEGERGEGARGHASMSLTNWMPSSTEAAVHITSQSHVGIPPSGPVGGGWNGVGLGCQLDDYKSECGEGAWWGGGLERRWGGGKTEIENWNLDEG